MRELTKSLLHCSWALSVFGAHQLRNVALQRSALQLQEFAEALDNVAEAACRDLSPWELTAYRIGTTIQDGLVDIVFRGAGSLTRTIPAVPPRVAVNAVRNAARTEALSWMSLVQRSEMPPTPAYAFSPARANEEALSDGRRLTMAQARLSR